MTKMLAIQFINLDKKLCEEHFHMFDEKTKETAKKLIRVTLNHKLDEYYGDELHRGIPDDFYLDDIVLIGMMKEVNEIIEKLVEIFKEGKVF